MVCHGVGITKVAFCCVVKKLDSAQLLYGEDLHFLEIMDNSLSIMDE